MGKMRETSKIIALPDGTPVRLIGALDVIPTQGENGGKPGLMPIRLPRQAFGQFAEFMYESVKSVVCGGSGIRLAFRITARRVSLGVRCTRTDFEGGPPEEKRFSCTVDGRKFADVPAPVNIIRVINEEGNLVSLTRISEESRVVFSDLPQGDKTVTIWLPQSFSTELLYLQVDAPISPAPESGRPAWIHHGSSISDCYQAETPLSVWPVAAACQVDIEVTNLGFSGQCMLDPFVARAIAQTDADFISISCGVNIVGERAMDRRVFEPALHGFLDIIRQGHPDTPILLVSSIYWPGSDDVPGPADIRFHEDGTMTCYCYGDKADIAKGAMTLGQSRFLVERVVRRRRIRGENIAYLNGLELFGPEDVERLALVDGLHPSTETYEEIAQRFVGKVFPRKGFPRAFPPANGGDRETKMSFADSFPSA